MICKPWTVVTVPFPFTEKSGTKRRPALVISKQKFNRAGHTLLAMITSSTQASWPGDTPITEFKVAGLGTPCIVRLKLFTLDNRLLIRELGTLDPKDIHSVFTHLHHTLPEF